jgi:hypothetical protein
MIADPLIVTIEFHKSPARMVVYYRDAEGTQVLSMREFAMGATGAAPVSIMANPGAANAYDHQNTEAPLFEILVGRVR